ncbi:hypothetical protein FIBSPDRAFT_879918 [Athelia psychrophila]|uniref:Uncharacterized protein n=1 Tax=Athelia psychrophila TaxID=1759441 RepID=A0A167TGL2_9AGAM|nr:hypothetical protein FIBSPDRAFT_879918 [Fibularhizoctonia sp. CBS 109695]
MLLVDRRDNCQQRSTKKPESQVSKASHFRWAMLMPTVGHHGSCISLADCRSYTEG